MKNNQALTFKWVVAHPYSKNQVKNVLVLDAFGFQPSLESLDVFERDVREGGWKAFRVIVKKGQITFAMIWDTKQKESYLDYIYTCGVWSGRILSYLETHVSISDTIHDEEDEEDEEDHGEDQEDED
jgi:hypothetical protein